MWYSNFETCSKQQSIACTNANDVLLHTAEELCKKRCGRRIQVRLIGIRFTRLIPGNYQVKLFEDTHEMIRLYQAIDSVKRRYGEQLLLRQAE